MRVMITLIALVSPTCIAVPAQAQLRFQAGSVATCDATAERAAAAIFNAKKLKLDQSYWGRRRQQVNRNAVYQMSLRNLEREQTRTSASLASGCRVHFRGRQTTPWRYEWSY